MASMWGGLSSILPGIGDGDLSLRIHFIIECYILFANPYSGESDVATMKVGIEIWIRIKLLFRDWPIRIDITSDSFSFVITYLIFLITFFRLTFFCMRRTTLRFLPRMIGTLGGSDGLASSMGYGLFDLLWCLAILHYTSYVMCFASWYVMYSLYLRSSGRPSTYDVVPSYYTMVILEPLIVMVCELSLHFSSCSLFHPTMNTLRGITRFTPWMSVRASLTRGFTPSHSCIFMFYRMCSLYEGRSLKNLVLFL